MRKFLTEIIAIALCSICLLSCEDEDLCLVGSGTAENYTLELDPFTRIQLLGPVNLEVTQGASQSVMVVAEPEMWAEMTHEVRSGELEIGFEGNVTCFETEVGVRVMVTVPDVERISQTGLSEIVSSGDLDLDRLTLDLEGESAVFLSGVVTEQVINVAGLTDINNFDLESASTSINLAGEGDFEITCTDQLFINVGGAAVVKYKGSPQISQNVSGTLSLVDSN